ncbi:MAG: hypothetical protein EZS28_000171 [Streblomastix strix]|uniref:Uncharacterized protein n=1 Tax=Streblomastix strix TaxID=222440 RepID=A0A5J4XCR2_9EUKA|nr:MAG: hypothetical protein EZS28_000171 [Streblomastix strix]
MLMIDSKDKDIRKSVIYIISHIIGADFKLLKEGQQHPLRQQLTNDGTIAKMIQLYKDKENKNIDFKISEIIAHILKASELNADSNVEIIQLFKEKTRFDELALIAENPANHEAILSNYFVKKLFQYEIISLQSLNLTIPLLKFGSYNTKKLVILAIKQKVEILKSDQYLDKQAHESNYLTKEKKQIHIKAKIAFALIRWVEGMIEEEGDYEEIDAKQL